eukprot:Clim_evm11s155 gene=Clim_evmTU11s155
MMYDMQPPQQMHHSPQPLAQIAPQPTVQQNNGQVYDPNQQAQVQYSTPPQQHGTPTPQHGTPTPQHGTPTPQHGTPQPQHATPQPQHTTQQSVVEDEPPNVYDFWQLADATQQFSQGNLIGEGTFAVVYKGQLDGRWVAVKKLKGWGNHADQEFLRDINLLSRCRHKNIVKLLGYSMYEMHRGLVYELMPNGNLQDRLACAGNTAPLSWYLRLLVAKGACEGLIYLHHQQPPIFHRDFKSANVLLDADWTPKIADFGLSRVMRNDNRKSAAGMSQQNSQQQPQTQNNGGWNNLQQQPPQQGQDPNGWPSANQQQAPPQQAPPQQAPPQQAPQQNAAYAAPAPAQAQALPPPPAHGAPAQGHFMQAQQMQQQVVPQQVHFYQQQQTPVYSGTQAMQQQNPIVVSPGMAPPPPQQQQPAYTTTGPPQQANGSDPMLMRQAPHREHRVSGGDGSGGRQSWQAPQSPTPLPLVEVRTKDCGTWGYTCPEYIDHGMLNNRTDVYSYGVVLLELLTGQQVWQDGRPIDGPLQVYIVNSLNQGVTPEQLVDVKGGPWPPQVLHDFANLAKACVAMHSTERPFLTDVMSQVDAMIHKSQYEPH